MGHGDFWVEKEDTSKKARKMHFLLECRLQIKGKYAKIRQNVLFLKFD